MIAFENGVLDLSDPLSPKFSDFSPDFHVTYYRPYRYDEKASCDRWSLFLKEVLPDKTSRTILQMFMGLGFTRRKVAFSERWRRDNGKVELCLLLIGAGANGKSVIFEVMGALFGNDNISKIDYSTLTATGDEGLRGRYPIKGMIFNWSSDSNPKKFGKNVTELGVFNQLVSGEAVPIRCIGKDVEECNELPYFVFNMNALPAIDDEASGVMRRLQILPFDVVIPSSKRDPFLANKIIRNELPGVLNWVMRGTKELIRRKFKFPEAEGSQMALMNTIVRSSPLMAWIKTYKIRSSKLAPNEVPQLILGSELYETFVRFCKDNDVDDKVIPTVQKFGRDMRDNEKFFKKRHGSGVYYEVYGVTLEKLQTPIFVTEAADIGANNDDEFESFIKDED